MRFGLEYGFLDWLMAEMGRSLYDKTFDAFAKFSMITVSIKYAPVSLDSISLLKED